MFAYMKAKKETSTQKTEVTGPVNKRFLMQSLLVFLFGACLYANTLTHGFTQDDAIVIYDNMFTTKGIEGLKGLFTEDTFFGFFKEEGKKNLVSGGRYRPLTPAMFALEYEIAGKEPWLGHLMNVLLYGLLCLLVFRALLLLFNKMPDPEKSQYIALGATLLFAAHPLHTEAVANIKGRDEIVAMLGSVFTLMCMLLYHDKGKKHFLWLALITFFAALLAKENTITFLAIIPLSMYFFRNHSFVRSLSGSALLLIPAVIFLVIRASILGTNAGDPPLELMNNPYLKLVNGTYEHFDFSEKYATILFTLGKYIQLLLFPHPLTHDYYPRHIDIMHFGDAGVILSLLTLAGLAGIMIAGFKNKSLYSFSIAYYLITLSIVSNIVFPIGTNMSERFMFMPSLGFALGIAALLFSLLYHSFGKTAYFSVLALILAGYSLKTVTRNTVWKDDFTLFTTDVKTSGQSAKVLNAAGGAILTKYGTVKDEALKNEMVTQAVGYLQKAVEIHPYYKAAWLLLGNGYYYLNTFDKSITAYENALKIDPDFRDAASNLAIACRDAGRIAGEKEGNLEKAEALLQKSYQLSPNDAETLRLLGVANGIRGNHQEAIRYFTRVTELDPTNAGAFMNLSNAYLNTGDVNKASELKKKAQELEASSIKK
jgi:tetratricopeptide (TPR) repeat protein